jgi:hypothetical protein
VAARGSSARVIRCQARRSGIPATRTWTRVPRSSWSATASRESRVIPRPTSTASRMAPLEPMVSVGGARPAAARYSSVVARVPEPGSRSSQVWRASSSGRGERPSSPGGATRTSGFERSARLTSGEGSGGRPPITRSTSWCSRRAKTRGRLATSRLIPTAGWRARKPAMSRGRSCSPAVVTAARRIRPRSGAAAPAVATAASSSRPRTRRAYPASTVPAGVRRRPRPSRATSRTPSSFWRAAIWEETAGWVTKSRSAAPRTDPVEETSRSERS